MSIIQQPNAQCNIYRSPTTNGSRHPSDLPFHEFLDDLPWRILCSIDGLIRKHGRCCVNISYWMNVFGIPVRTIERAMEALKKGGLIETKQRGRTSKEEKYKGAFRFLTEKAKELMKSRKTPRRQNERAHLQSLADHNSLILNRSYNQESKTNLSYTKLPTSGNKSPEKRDIISILEAKLREKSAKIGETIMSRAKKWFGKDENRYLNVSHPYAYANTLIRQYETEQEQFRKSAQSAEIESKKLNAHEEYKQPDQSLVDNFMTRMRNLLNLGGLSEKEESP